MAQRVLVTGATGQLGAYLVRELVEQGIEVVAWGGSQANEVSGVPARSVDITDRTGLSTAFAEARPAVVIHAAALSAVADCARDPARAQAVNADGTANLVCHCRAAGT